MSVIKDLWLKLWKWLKPILTVKKIWSFVTSKTFLIILVLIVVLMLGRSCARNRDAQRIIDINNQNIAALTDEIKVEKRKNGQLELSIAAYVLTEKDLKKVNEELYNEVKNQKGKVLSLNKIVFQLKQDTAELRSHINYLESIMSQPIQINDSTYAIGWQLNYDWDQINFDVFKGNTYVKIVPRSNVPKLTWKDGVVNASNFNTIFNNTFVLSHQKTELIDRLSQVDLVFGQKVEDDMLRIFVTTQYPGFTASSLSGVLIDPNTNPYIKDLMKKKKWFPNTWSVGVGPSFGYNVLTSKLYLGVGVNINYNLLQW